MASRDLNSLIMLVTSAQALGTVVRNARTDAGLKQTDAARLCGVGRRFFVDIEKGKATVRMDKALKVLGGLGLFAVVLPSEIVQQALPKN